MLPTAIITKCINRPVSMNPRRRVLGCSKWKIRLCKYPPGLKWLILKKVGAGVSMTYQCSKHKPPASSSTTSIPISNQGHLLSCCWASNTYPFTLLALAFPVSTPTEMMTTLLNKSSSPWMNQATNLQASATKRASIWLPNKLTSHKLTTHQYRVKRRNLLDNNSKTTFLWSTK